jgi:hypothetical protein
VIIKESGFVEIDPGFVKLWLREASIFFLWGWTNPISFKAGKC